MVRKKNAWIAIVSALCSGLLLYGIYQVQLKQIELQKTTGVIVPSKFIDAGTLLTKDMLEVKQIYISGLHPEMVTELATLVGQETLVPLGQDEPVLAWKVSRFQLMPSASQATFQIPKDYILSIADGIRAGDQVNLYVSDALGSSNKLFNESITVAAVKTASGTEVQDNESSHLLSKVRNNQEQIYASRRDANAPIETINLNLSEQQWLDIDRLCKNGEAKLVIAFASSIQLDHLKEED